MKPTSDTLEIARRAANILGWSFANSGRSYFLVGPKDVHDMFEGLTYTKFELMALMLRVLSAPERFEGGGLTAKEIADNLYVRRIKMPKKVSAQNEAIVNRINRAATGQSV